MCTERRRFTRGAAHHAAGFTLPELLLLMVVFAVGLVGILLVTNTVVAGSADPMVRKQAMAIAESMMEEVLLMPYAQGPGSGARANFDDVRDYNGFNTQGIYRLEDGTPVPGLANYDLSVAVTPAAIGGVAASAALQVTITVTGPHASYALTGYKLDY